MGVVAKIYLDRGLVICCTLVFHLPVSSSPCLVYPSSTQDLVSHSRLCKRMHACSTCPILVGHTREFIDFTKTVNVRGSETVRLHSLVEFLFVRSSEHFSVCVIPVLRDIRYEIQLSSWSRRFRGSLALGCGTSCKPLLGLR
jgi:hypothetical protein